MSRRSRRRRVLPSGAPGWKPGYGPGEPHGPNEFGDAGPFPPDRPPGEGTGEGGVREPRRPKPSPPALSAEALPPEPPIVAADHTIPPPGEVTPAVAEPAGV